MDIKTLRNGQWVDAELYTRRNGQWVRADAYTRRNGQWVNLTSQVYTDTFWSSWTQTYRTSGTKRTDYRADKLVQGYYGEAEPWGLQRSLCGFGDIQSKIAGSRIKKVELYLYAEHWWYYAGGTAVIGYHNHSNEPDRFGHSVYGAKYQKFSYRGQGMWVDMPISLGEGIRDGYYKGISIFADSYARDYYGVFSGAWDGGNAPRLKITYEK
ncbi:hypothetical protein CN984_12260 [Bacillus cereus]|uniref:Uncharacterized protein n=1 Tax=Bacillus cereus TaxID=1396 RepID=A0A2A7FP45_BACCE|nr:hypothetical protein CON44_17835 [Bacillus cereus]PGO29208.1 hypothetical protein CN984_12260 [Bacillus cereus]